MVQPHAPLDGIADGTTVAGGHSSADTPNFSGPTGRPAHGQQTSRMIQSRILSIRHSKELSRTPPTLAGRAHSVARLRVSHYHGAIVLTGANFNAFTSDSDMLKAHDSQRGVLVGLCQYVVGDLQDMQHSTIPPCPFVIQCGSGAT